MKLDKRAGERQIDIRIQAGQTAPSQKKEEKKEKIDISCKKSPLEGRRLLEPKCPF